MDCQYDRAKQTAITAPTIYQATNHKIAFFDIADNNYTTKHIPSK